MWFLYIVKCKDKSFYTGITTDIVRRLKEHNARRGGSYTRIRTPVKLVYQENQVSRSEAQRREAQIKRWARSKKLALIRLPKKKGVKVT